MFARSQAMELTCKFGLEYQPLGETADPVAEEHVRNCADCQEQVTLV